MDYAPFSLSSFRGAVKALVLTHTAVFFAQWVLPGTLEAYFGLIPVKALLGFQVWRLATYLFLHGGFFHYLINMFILWMFGKELENVWGAKEFVKYYFLCGVGAGLFNMVFTPLSTIAVIGASGAIYGILAGFAMLYPEVTIYLYGIIPMRSKHFVIFLGVLEFFTGLRGASGAISAFAHLGGLVTGYAYLKSYEFRSFCENLIHKFISLFIVRKNRFDVVEDSSDPDETLVKEVDRILQKVLAQGADSLTDQERQTMRKYSSRNK